MELKAEHIIPYLTYDLYFYRTEEHVDCEEIPCKDLGTFYQQETQLNNMTLSTLLRGEYKEPKLILTALEGYSVTEERYGTYYAEFPDEFRYDAARGEVEYCYMVKLFEDHVDVFGLIEKGLAVSKEEVKEIKLK